MGGIIISSDKGVYLLEVQRNGLGLSIIGHQNEQFYCANPKSVNTRIIFGMLLCCKEEANQMQEGKTASCNGN